MDQAAQLPTAGRVVGAFIIAPFIGALIMAAVFPMYAGLPNTIERIWKTLLWYSVIGAYPTTLVFGIPTFFLLKGRVRPTAVNCILAGGVVAALPWAILSMLPPSAGSGAVDDGKVTILNGHRTLAGWLFAGENVVEVGAFGLIAGLVFWVVATRFRSPARAA